MRSLFLLCVALLLAMRAAVVHAADNDTETLALSYPTGTPVINYIDSIEVVFISTYEYPTLLATCESFSWVYFIDFDMRDDTEATATFTSVGADYLRDNATGVAFPWSCSIVLYYNSASASISSTSIGGKFLITSLANQRTVIYEESTTEVITESATSTTLIQATTVYLSSNATTTSSTTADTSATSSAASTAAAASTGLSSGAKAGIAVGCILGAALVGGLIAVVFFVRRRIRANEKRLEELQMQQQNQQRGSSMYGPVASPQSDSAAMAASYDPKMVPPQQPGFGVYATVPELPGDNMPRYEMGTDQPKPASPYRD